jgi:predicted NAD/FAD-binding protein
MARSAAACTAAHRDPARQGQTRTRKHGLFTRDAIAERRQIRALLGDARKLLEDMK